MSTFRGDALVYIIIAAIVVYAYYQQYNERNGPPPGSDYQKEGNGAPYYKGRGSEGDSVETLLNRIDWISRTERRLTIWTRMVFPAILATVVISLLVFKVKGKFPSSTDFVIMLVTVYLSSTLFHSFFYVHGDYYPAAYLRTNTILIRSKLNLPPAKSDPGNPLTDDVPDRVYLA